MKIYLASFRLVVCLLLLGVVLTSCASSQKSESTTAQTPTPAHEKIEIDTEGLKRSLGLDRSRMDLGYKEKRFNTCQAGFGYPRENCMEQVLISINFRLQCRDTTGTTSEIVTSSQLAPIASKTVAWKLGQTHSTTTTDGEGYGQVVGVLSPASKPRTQRLKLSVGSQFVYMRAGEITRIVTPSNWCSGN